MFIDSNLLRPILEVLQLRYVSRIVTKNSADTVYSRLRNGGPPLKGRVVLLDTTEPGHKFVNINWSGLHGVAGLAYDLEDECRAIVVHTKKTAKLHEHIESVSKLSGVVTSQGDAIVIGRHKTLRFIEKGYGEIQVNLPGRIFDIYGHFGSVVQLQSSVSELSQVLTLYDFIKGLCVGSGVNIACYNTICLYNDVIRQTISIRFKEDTESVIFLTKMSLEFGGLIRK